MLRSSGNRRAGFLQQLHRLLVYIKHWTAWVIRSFMDFQHIFHAGSELRVGRWRPLLVWKGVQYSILRFVISFF